MPWADNLDRQSAGYSVAASVARRVRVVAGPGTGKSFCMKRRVARLLEEGVPPRSILPVTFTRVAAEDLHRELVGMGVPGCEQIEGMTLHSLALKCLMRQHVLAATGRVPRPLNEFELKPLEYDLGIRHGGVREVKKKIKAYESAWARLQHEQPGFAQTAADRSFEQDLLSWMGFHKCMLIGEVIPYFYRYLRDNPRAPERIEFAHLLVDEFQDLNKAEQGVVELLSLNADVCIVGDDDQSIYSFKHAHPEGIREWEANNPLLADLTITECRRCPTAVVEMANSLIAANRSRQVARQLTPLATNGRGEVQILQFNTLDDEVTGVANRIAELVRLRTPPGDILVLAQRSLIGNPIYEKLTQLGVPVKSYYAESELHSQDTQVRFSYLKLLADQQDRVALRFLLGVSSANYFQKPYARLYEHCGGSGVSVWNTLVQIEQGDLSMAHTGNIVARFTEIRKELERLQAVFDYAGLLSLIDELFPDGDNSCRDIRNIALEILAESPETSPKELGSEIASRISKPEIPDEVKEVRIMSLHKSKGLSAPVTIVAGCVEGLLPKQPSADMGQREQNMAIEEQRRLFFVGITRVKSAPGVGKPGTLILTSSRMMPLAAARGSGILPAFSRHGIAHLHASRFLSELGATAPAPTIA